MLQVVQPVPFEPRAVNVSVHSTTLLLAVAPVTLVDAPVSVDHATFTVGLIIAPETVESALVGEDHCATAFTPVGGAVHVALVCVAIPVLNVHVDQICRDMSFELFFKLLLRFVGVFWLDSACTLHVPQVPSLPLHLLFGFHVERSEAFSKSLPVIERPTPLQQAAHQVLVVFAIACSSTPRRHVPTPRRPVLLTLRHRIG